MDAETVTRFFGAVWPLYCDDALDVDLLPFWWGDKHQSPFLCAVVWDSDRWAIVANADEAPKALFWQFWHELAHVLNGDVTKQGFGREVLKRAATGCLTWERDIDAAHQSVRASKATPTARAKERKADGWADDRARSWWRVLELLADDASDDAIAWAVKVGQLVIV